MATTPRVADRGPAGRPGTAPLTLGLDDPGAAASGTEAPAGAATSGPSGPAYLIRTDGAARGNPGPASSGAVLIRLDRRDAHDPGARPDATISEYLGIRTNNVAEYVGVVRALGLAAELGATRVELLLDSKLIVEQLHGRWRVKDAKLRPLWADALRILREFRGGWTAAHVPRAQNGLADALANAAIDRVAAGGPPVVVTRPE
jgi:ribonuclease HI